VPLLRRLVSVYLCLFVLAEPASAHRTGAAECGSTRESTGESLFLHRQAARARAARPQAVATAATANQDIGDIAIIQDLNGVVERQNQFNLDGNTLTFTPVSAAAAQYRYSVAAQGFDTVAASAGAPLAALGDDDSRLVNLPFPFAFFGVTYNQVFVNSDGNLTFVTGDSASTQRSLGRMTAGPPRISPLFDDLNPALTAGGVRVLADATRVVVSWVSVPEYSDTNTGAPQNFQARLYADGHIDFSYSGVNPTSAVVGIAPGSLKGATTIVDYRSDAGTTYSGSVAEVFGNTLTVDVVTVAQQFYQTHDDSYDYLAIYNNMDIPALGEGTVAYEQTVRNSGSGFGVPVEDAGRQYGSASRLQSVLNLGPLGQYPTDPNALVPARAQQADTPVTILTHEAGHRFLAFASVSDPNNPVVLPMLGFQLAHWSFLFDSEASVMEGERISDRGGAVSPEFLTTDLTQGYAPLDQYLMGFRPAAQVPDVFLVQNPSPNYAPTLHQFSGISFNGVRRNISVADVIQAEGRRTPDDTVAQRRFRFAFILVVAAGTQPSAADLAKLDAYRQQFQAFYTQAASNNAIADATLKRSMKLSLYPSAGIVKGTGATASLTVATPPAADLTVQLATPDGNAKLPPSVKIPAGGASVTFPIAGVNSGVEEVQAIPGDPAYETAFARVQVADAAAAKLTAQLAPGGPVIVRLSDVNELPYAGAGIIAVPSEGGSVIPSEAFTDAQGQASFRWNQEPGAVNRLQLSLDGVPAVTATVSSGTAVPSITAVVNAASLAPGIAPGSLAAILGSNLTGVTLLLNGAALPALPAAPGQIDFDLPPDTPPGPATFTAIAPSGEQSTATVIILPLAPGIFDGGVRRAGGGIIHAGDYIEIYCTGLGPVQAAGSLQVTQLIPTVFVGAVPLQPVFSGLAPGYAGIYQLDVQIPSNTPSGLQTLLLSVDNAHSNSVTITVQ
jgi:uncharacterized protein (TIGR03437 family)